MHSDHPAQDLESVVDENTQFIDVRPAVMLADGAVEGTTSIPMDDLGDNLDQLDRDRRVVLICRSGKTSKKAAKFLDANAFVDVINLEGGMLALDKAN